MEKEKTIRQIVAGIEKGRLPETKEILMLQDFCGDSVAHILASRSDKTHWSTKNKDMLMLRTMLRGDTVAHILAGNSGETGWTTEDREILMLQNKAGVSVAHNLA